MHKEKQNIPWRHIIYDLLSHFPNMNQSGPKLIPKAPESPSFLISQKIYTPASLESRTT